MRRRVPRLPDAYQEVDYIESSGTQYIDTGVSANQYLSYEAELVALGTTTDSPLFGARTGATNNRFGLIVYGGNFHMMIGNTSAESFNNTPVDTNRHTCSVFVNNGSYTATIDGNTSTGSTSTTAYVNQNFWLFKYNYGSVAPCPMRLYYFKLYTGSSTLVRDFVPCYRKSDSVIGMYDLVNNQFYTNAGSGTFTKGTDSSTLEFKEFLVRPNNIHYEVDLTQLTLVNPSYWGGNIIVESGEIYTSGDGGIAYMDFSNFSLSSAKKIKITYDCYCKGKTWANPTAVRIGNTIPNNQGNRGSNQFGVGCATQTASGYTNVGVLEIGGTNYYTATTGNQVPLNTWSNVSGEVDLVNKTIKYTVNNVDKFSGSITDTSVSNFTTNIINVTPRYLGMFLENGNRVKNIVINIE